MDPTQPSFTANVQNEAPIESGEPMITRSVEAVKEEASSIISEVSKMPAGWKKRLLIVGAAILAVVLWMWLSSPMIVTVTGSGEASVPATNATVSFTISASDASVQAVVSNVNNRASTFMGYLTSKGIVETDIAQSQVTVVPAGLVTAGATGYQATISISAKTTHINGVSTLITDLYSNGALVVGQPVLSVENQSTLDQQAFDLAMKDAESQAAKIGNSKWKFIRKIISISQVSSPTTSTSTTKADALTSASNSTAALNGVFKIVKAVSVSYKMW